MSVTRTYTVTVVSTDSGNKYFIDGVQQDTVNIAENFTYRFDQSDSSNLNHPLRFSTTSNGTHSGGSEYTTGVTTNGTPGNSGAYTQITVAASAPTLYYYCSNHSGMGGQANTPTGNTWGMLSWNSNFWGSQDGPNISVTGLSANSSIGSVTVSTEINVGWGRAAWNDDAWGIAGDILLDGVSATGSVGSLFPAYVIGVTGVAATTSVGSLSPADVIGITGVSATSSLGTAETNSNPTISVSGLSATASVGSLDVIDAIGITGLSATSSVGSLTPEDVMGLTGVSATTSVAGFGTASGFGIQAYQTIDTGSNTSYTDVAA